METVTVSPAWHETSGELIDNNYLVVFDDVIDILLEQTMSLQCLLHVVVYLNISWFIEIFHSKKLFNPFNPVLGQYCAPRLFIHGEMKISFQARHDLVNGVVLVC